MDPGFHKPGCGAPSTTYIAVGNSIRPHGEPKTDGENAIVQRSKVTTSMKKKLKTLRNAGVDTSKLTLADVESIMSAQQTMTTWSQGPDGDQSMDGLKMSAAMKKQLKSLQKSGVDTSHLSIEDIISVTSFKQFPQTWSPGLGRHSFINEPRVKKVYGTRQMSKKISDSCITTVSGINIAVIPRNRPKDAITEEDAERIKLQIIEKIDSMEAGAPRFEGCKYVDGYLGLICSDQDTFQFMRDFFESSEYEVVETKDLPSRTKVVAYLPEKAEANLIFKRLTVQNPGLNCQEWTVIGRNITETGFLLFLAIDEDSHDFLVNQSLKLNYLLSSISFLVVAEKDGEPPGQYSFPESFTVVSGKL